MLKDDNYNILFPLARRRFSVAEKLGARAVRVSRLVDHDVNHWCWACHTSCGEDHEGKKGADYKLLHAL